MNKTKIGHFCSMENGLGAAASQAHESGSTTLMVYTGSPQSYYKRPIRELNIEIGQIMMKEYGLTDLVVHAGFLINPASPEQEKREKAEELLLEEIQRAEAIGSNKLVLHPGSYTTSNQMEGIKNCAKTLNNVLSSYLADNPKEPVTVCLETMAGKGHEIGRNFDELKQIIDLIDDKHKQYVGVCLDTCHLNDAGYDMTDLMKLIDIIKNTVGIDRVKVLHINDSLSPRGLSKDRHAGIGKGTIGLKPLKAIVNHPIFEHIPKILETPDYNFKEEISMLLS